MVKARFKLTDPDKLEATLTLTMTVGEWKELRQQISDDHPGWKVTSAISDVVTAAEKVWVSDGEAP